MTATQSEDALDISGVIKKNPEPSIQIIHIPDVSDQQFEVQSYSSVIELPVELLESTELIFTEQDLCTSLINTEVQTGL